MAAKFELKKSVNNQYYFSLKAANGETVLSGETYDSKASAQGGAESVQRNAANDSRFERQTAGNGEGYFVLRAENGEQIARSETYSSPATMEKGIAAVKKDAPGAQISDLT